LTFFPYLKPEGRTGTIDNRLGDSRTTRWFPPETPDNRPAERPQIDLIGEAVALGPLNADLLDKYQTWLSYYGEDRELPGAAFDSVDIEFEFSADFGDSEDIYFTVYELGSWRPIGGAALTEIDYADQVAEFSLIIGESDCRGKGYGSESTRLVLDYAFNALGLHHVMLSVYEYNYSARGAFHRAGFREFSRRRDCHLEGARLWDEIYMGCLAGDFNQLLGEGLPSTGNLNA
jgi:RimJ/RimL family protein N-acetyltransferase